MPKIPDSPATLVDAIAKLMIARGDKTLLPLLEKAEVQFEKCHDSWGDYVRRLVFNLPFDDYVQVSGRVTEIEDCVSQLLTQVTRVCDDGPLEYVRLSHNFDATSDWRTSARPKAVYANDVDRIWKPGHFRLFLSHVSQFKVEVASLKASFAKRFVDGFVAHADIEPSAQWLNEIEIALASCHAIAALVTPGFHASCWCMQEVGWGLGRGVLVLPIQLPDDPKGFIGSVQALHGEFDNPHVLRDHVVSVLATNSRTEIEMHEPLVRGLEGSVSPIATRITLESLKKTNRVSVEHATRIRDACESNVVLKGKPYLAKIARTIANQYIPTDRPEKAPSEAEYDPFADE